MNNPIGTNSASHVQPDQQARLRQRQSQNSQIGQRALTSSSTETTIRPAGKVRSVQSAAFGQRRGN